MALSRAAECNWVFGAYLLLYLSFASFQPVNTLHEGLVYDGQHYFAMARQTPRDLPPKAPAPFVYRVGTPMLAAAIAKPLDWVLARGFDHVNTAATLTTVLLLSLWLRRHVAEPAARLLVVIFFMVSPHGPMRFANYYPINVDPAGLMFVMAGLVALDWLRCRPTVVRVAAVSFLVTAGVAFREVVLVVGLMALLLRVAPRTRYRAFAWMPLAGGLVMLFSIRAWVVETHSDYSTLVEVARWSREKSVIQFILAWFLAYGPALTLILFQARASIRTLWARPDWLVYLVAGAAAALFGGSDTERLLVFVSPIVYLLMAQSLTRSGFPMTSPAVAILVVLQLVSFRVFVPIGAPTPPPNVVGTEWNRLPTELAKLSSYDSLWTQFCGAETLRFYLVWFGALAIGIVAVSRLAGRRRGGESP